MSQNFDGTGDYIAVPDADSLDFGTGSFGLAMWCYSTNTGTQDIINTNRATAGAATAGYGITISSVAATGISAHFGDGTNFARIDSGTTALRGGSTWFHLVCNFDRSGNTVYIYFNTSLANSGSCAAVTASSSNAVRKCIASNSTAGRYFFGALSDVVFIDRIFTAGEMSLLYNSKIKRLPLQLFGTNLKGYWPLDYTPNLATVPTTSGAMLDLTSNLNHGTAAGNGTGLNETFLSYQ